MPHALLQRKVIICVLATALLVGSGVTWAAADDPPPDTLEHLEDGLGDAVDEARSNPERLYGTIREILAVDVSPGGEDANDVGFWLLTQVFGDVIWIPWGYDATGSVTVLSRVLGLVNVVAFALALVLMGFVLLSALINTAQDGVPLGRDVDTFWMPVRNGLAMVLMVPVGGLGGGTFSIAQVMVLWMLVAGSSAGSYVWDEMTTLLASGAEITNRSTPRETDSAEAQRARELAKAMACAATVAPVAAPRTAQEAVQDAHWGRHRARAAAASEAVAEPRTHLSPVPPSDPGVVGLLEPPSTSSQRQLPDYAELIDRLAEGRGGTIVFEGSCGSLHVPTAASQVRELADGDLAALCADADARLAGRCQHAAALRAIEHGTSRVYAHQVVDLRDIVVVPILRLESPVAFAQRVIRGDPDAADAVDAMAAQLLHAVREDHARRRAVVDEALAAEAEAPGAEWATWQERMSERGWAYAGTFFLDLAGTTRRRHEASAQAYAEVVGPQQRHGCWALGPAGTREGGIGCEEGPLPQTEIGATIVLADLVGARAVAMAGTPLGGAVGGVGTADPRATPLEGMDLSGCGWHPTDWWNCVMEQTGRGVYAGVRMDDDGGGWRHRRLRRGHGPCGGPGPAAAVAV